MRNNAAELYYDKKQTMAVRQFVAIIPLYKDFIIKPYFTHVVLG